MDQETELSIIEAAKDNPEAFSVIFNKYYSLVFNYALYRIANVPVAQDVTSEVFYKALKHLHKYKSRGHPFSSWLYRITNNEIVNHYRNNNHDRLYTELILNHHESSNPSVETELIEEEETLSRYEEYLELHNSISKLPIKYQEVITLRYFEKKQVKEIAYILNKSEGTIKSLLHRGLKRLRQLIYSEQSVEEKVAVKARGNT